MDNVTKQLIKEIRDNLSQTSASQKDEYRVMRSMLNDKNYVVDVYGNSGKIGTYSPFEDSRDMVSNIIVGVTHMTKPEADQLAEQYEFKNSDAVTLVNLSKEFVHTYLQTGRKLPFGGREKSNIALSVKDVEESTRLYPKKVGINSDGSDRYEKVETKVPAYQAIKSYAPCPRWVSNK